MNEAAQFIERVVQNVKRVIVGKDDRIRAALCTWISGGHLLIEDVPGTGKTLLARALAQSVAVDFKRIQFTPDLLPSDVTGTAVFSQKKGGFEFLRGPLFTTIFLGDEINRATPRTQSALLESMAEGQITAEGTTFKLDPAFFVIATQNPVEQHGTFPLPEAQLDRFMMKVSMGYPSPAEEITLAKNVNRGHPILTLKAVETIDRLKAVQALVPEIQVIDPVYQYAMDIVAATRRSHELKLGASPRALLAFIRAAQGMALMDGLKAVRATHLFNLARPVLAHRLIPTSEARISGRTQEKILDDLLQGLKPPLGRE